MIELVNNILKSQELISAHLIFFLLIFTRWLMLTVLVPFLGASLIPQLVRISLAGLLSLLSYIIINHQVAQLLPMPNIFIIILLFIKEALLGLILGFLCSLIFYTYDLVGRLIDFSRAASMAQLLVPELKTQSSPLGSLLFQLSLVIFVSLGLHREFIKDLILSFNYFPVNNHNQDILNPNNLVFVFFILSQLLRLAFSLALPAIFVCFLIDFGFGLLNRVAPQINAYFLSLPAKIIGGLAILFCILPFLLEDFLVHVDKISVFFKNFITTNK